MFLVSLTFVDCYLMGTIKKKAYSLSAAAIVPAFVPTRGAKGGGVCKPTLVVAVALKFSRQWQP